MSYLLTNQQPTRVRLGSPTLVVSGTVSSASHKIKLLFPCSMLRYSLIQLYGHEFLNRRPVQGVDDDNDDNDNCFEYRPNLQTLITRA